MKFLIKAVAVSTTLAFLSSSAIAGQRYATPPPIALSPDLSSAWTLQIKPRQLKKKKRWKSKASTSRKRRKKSFRIIGKARRAKKPSRSIQTTRSGVRIASINKQTKRTNHSFDPQLLPKVVSYEGGKPGSLVVNTIERRLYLVLPGGKARRYAIGVGKPGFEWSGNHKISRKAEWPDWRPPAEMIERERKKGRTLPAFMPGGQKNPLGARALYLGSTIYRIHGTNQNWSIGKAVSSGCIRMRNQDVMDLYERVPVGARVKVI